MNEKDQNSVVFPEDIQEKAKKMISEAFRLFGDHTRRMTEDLAEFNQKHQETQRRIQHGARRTTGRIV